MQTQQLAFSSTFQSPAGGAPVEVLFSGHAQLQLFAPDPQAAAYASAAVQQAVQTVVGGRLARNELALPTLAMSLPHLLAEIAAQARLALSQRGLQLGDLALQASVPQHGVAPAAAAIAAAPTPLSSVAGSFASNLGSHVASSIPTGVKVKVGGFSVRADKDGIDGGHFASQLADKAKDKLLGCAIVGGVVLLLGLITAAVLAKILLFG